MNNLLLCIVFLFGFSFCVDAQSLTPSRGQATLLRPTTSIQRTKDQITTDLQIKLAGLSAVLQSPQVLSDETTLKMKTAEAMLFKVLLADILNGRQIREAYEANFQQFLIDFTAPTAFWQAQRVVVANDLNKIVYLN